jgi:very-short-patch-repair endonuclease
MKLSGSKKVIERARRFRQQMSKPERLLWWALRRNQTGFHFRRQQPAGLYVLDFYCDAARLCVEVDGKQHDFQQASDRRRDAYLLSLGVMTVRVQAHEVTASLDGVVQLIVEQARLRAAPG